MPTTVLPPKGFDRIRETAVWRHEAEKDESVAELTDVAFVHELQGSDALTLLQRQPLVEDGAAKST